MALSQEGPAGGGAQARRVAIVVGTRPELIKMMPVLLALRARAEFRVSLVATGQHRELSDQACAAFGVEPDLDLGVMKPGQAPAEAGARVLEAVGAVLARSRPDAVLVHGDTTTCLYAALAAFYARVPIGHVEAGLRTHDPAAPWPEEMNRRLTDPLCRWCFAPTPRAAANLRAEGIPEQNVFVTGNTAVDALRLALERVRAQPPEIPELPSGLLAGRRLVVVTLHRRESFGEPLRELCAALREIAERERDVVIVYPVHPNPEVEGPVRELLGGEERIRLIRPLDHLQFVALLERSTLIVTDSGGIQEEAPTLRKPVLVTRRTTERPEALERGLACLVGTSRPRLVEEALRLLGDPAAREAMTATENPYGDGHAAERIAQALAATI